MIMLWGVIVLSFSIPRRGLLRKKSSRALARLRIGGFTTKSVFGVLRDLSRWSPEEGKVNSVP